VFDRHNRRLFPDREFKIGLRLRRAIHPDAQQDDKRCQFSGFQAFGLLTVAHSKGARSAILRQILGDFRQKQLS